MLKKLFFENAPTQSTTGPIYLNTFDVRTWNVDPFLRKVTNHKALSIYFYRIKQAYGVMQFSTNTVHLFGDLRVVWWAWSSLKLIVSDRDLPCKVRILKELLYRLKKNSKCPKIIFNVFKSVYHWKTDDWIFVIMYETRTQTTATQFYLQIRSTLLEVREIENVDNFRILVENQSPQKLNSNVWIGFITHTICPLVFANLLNW